MSEPVYKVVVVGMGKRGKHHAAAFHANPRFEVVGICDIDPARLDAAAAKTWATRHIGTDAAALVKEVKPDVFCFATLPNLRYDMVKVGVEGGAKLIAYEKPVALTTHEALKIMKLVREAGVKTVVSHQHRYGVHYAKVKEIIASGAIGRVHTVYGHSTGWMMHMMTHMIDYAAGITITPRPSGSWRRRPDALSSPTCILPPTTSPASSSSPTACAASSRCGAGAPDVPEVDYWWRKCRIGAQGTDGFAEVLTGGGWRAVTKAGASSGGGCMNYDLDMPPYMQEIADWLDDDRKVSTPAISSSAYKGFEIMMALCRSVVNAGRWRCRCRTAPPNSTRWPKPSPTNPCCSPAKGTARNIRTRRSSEQWAAPAIAGAIVLLRGSRFSVWKDGRSPASNEPMWG